MVDTALIEEDLVGWLHDQQEASVRHELPGLVGADEGIRIYLLEFEQEPTAQGLKRAPLQVWLRYLLTVADPDVRRGNQRLWNLLVQAHRREAESQGQWQVESTPLPVETWRALGVAPRPSLVVRIRVQQFWEGKVPKRVEKPLQIARPGAGKLRGVVRGPDSTPLAGAVVQMGERGPLTQTDSKGFFEFSKVPASTARPRFLRVRTRGIEQTVDLPLETEAPGAIPDDSGLGTLQGAGDLLERPMEIVLKF